MKFLEKFFPDGQFGQYHPLAISIDKNAQKRFLAENPRMTAHPRELIFMSRSNAEYHLATHLATLDMNCLEYQAIVDLSELKTTFYRTHYNDHYRDRFMAVSEKIDTLKKDNPEYHNAFKKAEALLNGLTVAASNKYNLFSGQALKKNSKTGREDLVHKDLVAVGILEELLFLKTEAERLKLSGHRESV